MKSNLNASSKTLTSKSEFPKDIPLKIPPPSTRDNVLSKFDIQNIKNHLAPIKEIKKEDYKNQDISCKSNNHYSENGKNQFQSYTKSNLIHLIEGTEFKDKKLNINFLTSGQDNLEISKTPLDIYYEKQYKYENSERKIGIQKQPLQKAELNDKNYFIFDKSIKLSHNHAHLNLDKILFDKDSKELKNEKTNNVDENKNKKSELIDLQHENEKLKKRISVITKENSSFFKMAPISHQEKHIEENENAEESQFTKLLKEVENFKLELKDNNEKLKNANDQIHLLSLKIKEARTFNAYLKAHIDVLEQENTKLKSSMLFQNQIGQSNHQIQQHTIDKKEEGSDQEKHDFCFMNDNKIIKPTNDSFFQNLKVDKTKETAESKNSSSKNISVNKESNFFYSNEKGLNTENRELNFPNDEIAKQKVHIIKQETIKTPNLFQTSKNYSSKRIFSDEKRILI